MVSFKPHPSAVYFDGALEQWVGEHERWENFELHRDTEWFDTEGEARRFARTGER